MRTTVGRTIAPLAFASLLLCLALVAPPDAAGAARAPARSTKAMVAAAAPEAVEAGLTMLRAGGNAVDAAVAASFVLAVVEPQSSGIGGGGFLVLHLSSPSRETSFDYRERAPEAATRDMYVGPDGRANPDASRWTGDATGVPGLVAGLVEVHRRFGKRKLAQVLAPAVALARDGVPVSERVAQAIAASLPRMNVAARAIFAPEGEPLPAGALLVQRDLADTLATVARDRGRSFYRGEIAQRIVAGVRAAGGRMRLADLAHYVVVERPPIRGEFQGLSVVSMGPPSSGGVHLVQMLNLLSRYPLGEWGYGCSRTMHLMLEAMRVAYRDRALYLGDPDYVDVPVARLLHPAYAALRAREIEWSRAGKSVLPETETPPVPAEPGHTTQLCVIDQDGSAVSATHSVNLMFGARFVAEGTGIVLNNELDDFSAAPGQPNAFGLVGGQANAVAPGKRPLSSMTPTILLKDGGVVLVVGSPGGSTIITTVLQIVLNVVVHGMDVSEAVAAPRFHHQWLPDEVRIERRGFSADTLQLLRRMGYGLVSTEPWGNASAIARDPATGELTGAADPRGVGIARGL